ncbi:DUF2993 domain-containing protein [Chlorogloeopsis fritschii PCC 9212]|uniref:DUF2993 domain-containing protein n=1 Tax=Chlorogloeopsis fritschii PCC 6912 TaxID=211165 RepID=A0A433NMI6_CHLFR|nr:DUF2993 domain-containing protein [Chlorogloeopsis fritschii]RUR84265.1 hypothetical protein PCC6912_18590 [Chlorogloeopsis fritschii PCC 6912]
MELLTILVSGLLGLIVPLGLVIDTTAENVIRSQLARAEQLQVRVDNAPTHQLLQGKVESVQIAGRSLQLKQQNINIAVLELETDEIELDPSSFRQKLPKLKQPLQAGVRLVLNQEDINKLLQSPEFLSRLRKFNIGGSSESESSSVYNFINPRVEILANNRLIFQVELQEENQEKALAIKVESGLSVVAGRQFQLIDPVVLVDGEEFPPQFLNNVVNNINQRLDLRNLEGDGLQVRILKLDMKPSKLEIAAFLRIEPSSKFLETRRS